MDKSKLAGEISRASRQLEQARQSAFHSKARVPDLIEALKQMAALRMAEGQVRRSESLLREAMRHADEMSPPRPDIAVGILSQIAHGHDIDGDAKAARQFYLEALGQARQRRLENHTICGTIHNNLGMLFKKDNNMAQALEHYEAALRIFSEAYGPESKQAASVLNNLGVLQYAMLNPEQALESHQKALLIRQKIHGADQPNYDLYQSYNNLGAVYKVLGDFGQAEEMMRQAGKFRLNGKKKLAADETSMVQE